MLGKLDPEENVMEETIFTKRKALAVCNQGVSEKVLKAIQTLGWDCYDDVTVEIDSESIIIIKNQDR